LPLPLDAREAAAAAWVPLDELRDPARHALWPAPGLPPEVRFPAIDRKGVRLWGCTYRLVTDWLELNPRERPMEAAGFQVARALFRWSWCWRGRRGTGATSRGSTCWRCGRIAFG
jgi:hypothetical protein